MYVCVCNAVTDKQIIKAANQGASSLRDLREQLNVGTCCGRCASCARSLLRDNQPQPLLAAADDLLMPVPA